MYSFIERSQHPDEWRDKNWIRKTEIPTTEPGPNAHAKCQMKWNENRTDGTGSRNKTKYTNKNTKAEKHTTPNCINVCVGNIIRQLSRVHLSFLFPLSFLWTLGCWLFIFLFSAFFLLHFFFLIFDIFDSWFRWAFDQCVFQARRVSFYFLVNFEIRWRIFGLWMALLGCVYGWVAHNERVLFLCNSCKRKRNIQHLYT